MNKFSEEKKDDILPAFLWIFLVATVAVFLILTATLLSRNGTFAGWKAQYKEWKEEKEAERRAAEAGEKTVNYFGPSGVAEYESWFAGEWEKAVAAGLIEGKQEEKQEETDPLRAELTKSPVNGSEGWWADTKKITGDVALYARAETPLYGEPDKKSEAVGYGRAGEEFRLFALFEDGWYVVTDGMYYYCSEGKYFTMVQLVAADIEEAASRLEKTKVFHEADTMLQNPELPHGCEVTGLAILFSHYGIEADKCVLADAWLPKGTWGQTDFRKAFVGNPRKTYSSAGCFATVIADTANRYLQGGTQERKSSGIANRLTAMAEEGISFGELLSLVEDAPVLAWTTMDLQAPYIAQVWEVDGEELYWQNMEHCVVLTGYDLEKGIFYGTDPLYGPCEYDMKLFWVRFQTMYSQVVWLDGDTP